MTRAARALLLIALLYAVLAGLRTVADFDRNAATAVGLGEPGRCCRITNSNFQKNSREECKQQGSQNILFMKHHKC